MDLNQALGRVIAAERGMQKKTLKDLSAQSEIPERTLIRYLHAERDFKITTLAAIANALGIAPHELVRAAEQIQHRFSEEEQGATITNFPRPHYDDTRHVAQTRTDDRADDTQD